MERIRKNILIIQETIRTQTANWIVSVSHKISLFIFIALVAAIILRWNQLPPQVPLWYGKPWGTDRLAEPYWLFILPAGCLIWHIINTLVSATVLRNYLVFSQLLFITSLIISILALFTLTKILLIVT